MRKHFLSVCIGIIIGLIVGTASGAFASVGQTVEASFQKFSLVVNGNDVVLDADPLVYQDSTYLPVRTVLNALGYDVGFMADTRTITADKTLSSLYAETENIFSREGEATVTETTQADIAEQIAKIEESLKINQDSLNQHLAANEEIRSSRPDTDGKNEELMSLRTPIIEAIQKSIADLEAKKAALEVQLQQ